MNNNIFVQLVDCLDRLIDSSEYLSDIRPEKFLEIVEINLEKIVHRNVSLASDEILYMQKVFENVASEKSEALINRFLLDMILLFKEFVKNNRINRYNHVLEDFLIGQQLISDVHNSYIKMYS